MVASPILAQEPELGSNAFLLKALEDAKAIRDTATRTSVLIRIAGRAARDHVDRAWPSWREVLEQDLLPVWRSVAESRRQARSA